MLVTQVARVRRAPRVRHLRMLVTQAARDPKAANPRIITRAARVLKAARDPNPRIITRAARVRRAPRVQKAQVVLLALPKARSRRALGLPPPHAFRWYLQHLGQLASRLRVWSLLHHLGQLADPLHLRLRLYCLLQHPSQLANPLQGRLRRCCLPRHLVQLHYPQKKDQSLFLENLFHLHPLRALQNLRLRLLLH